MKEEKCLPCAVHNSRKHIKEVVDELLRIRDEKILSLESKEESSEKDGAIDKVYDEYYTALAGYSILEWSDESNVMQMENGIYEVYVLPSHGSMFTMEIK